MKLNEIDDYDYTPRDKDFARFFDVEQKHHNGNEGFDTFYNINDGIVINGIDTLPSDDVGTYVCRNNDDLRLISYDLYGTTMYWWILAKINGIEDCMIELSAGKKIRYIKKYLLDHIFSEIMS